MELRKNPPKAEKKAAAPAANSNGSHQTAAKSDVSNESASTSAKNDSSDSKAAAEESKPLSNGAHAAEPAGAAAEVKEVKSVSKGAVSAADGEQISFGTSSLQLRSIVTIVTDWVQLFLVLQQCTLTSLPDSCCFCLQVLRQA